MTRVLSSKFASTTILLILGCSGAPENKSEVKLASFHANGENRIGLAISDDTLLDVDEILTRAGVNPRLVPRSMLELIEASPELWRVLREAAQRCRRRASVSLTRYAGRLFRMACAGEKSVS